MAEASLDALGSWVGRRGARGTATGRFWLVAVVRLSRCSRYSRRSPAKGSGTGVGRERCLWHNAGRL